MFSNKFNSVVIGKSGIADTIRERKGWLTIKNPLYQQYASTASNTDSSKNAAQLNEMAMEWQRARPFCELPRDGVFNFLRKFLPGGRYYNLDSTQLVMAMKEEYGNIYIVPGMMGRPDTVVTHHPDDFEHVFRNEGIWPIRPSSATLRYHRSKLRAEFYEGVEGTIATQGEEWSSFRSVVNPILMQPKNIKMYQKKIAEVNQEFVNSQGEQWSSFRSVVNPILMQPKNIKMYQKKIAEVNQEFVNRIRLIRNPETLEMPDDFEEYLQRWMLESVAVVALDKQLGLLRDDSENYEDALKLFSALTDFFTLTFDLEYRPSLWRIVATPKFKRLMKALDDIQCITWKHTTEAIVKLEVERQQGIKRTEREQSVLEKLLKIDKKIAAVMAMDLLMSGVDTTGSIAVGVLLCLAKNPEAQEKLRKEVKRILPQKDGDFTTDALSNIPYLRACLKEALRVYPLALGNIRVPQNDVVLSGFRVPKGTVVSMISATLLQSERHYPQPKVYLPERWLRHGKEDEERKSETAVCVGAAKASNPFIYLPFGVGPRACLGRRISDLEIELGIARLVRNFQIEFNHPTEKVFKGMLINMPNVPLKFKFVDIE